MVDIKHKRGICKLRGDHLMAFNTDVRIRKHYSFEKGKRVKKKDKMGYSLEIYIDGSYDSIDLDFSSQKKLDDAVRILDECC